MTASRRPRKTIRLNYWMADPKFAANITLYGDPGEVRISASESTFINVGDNGIVLSAGSGKTVSMQSFSSGITYAGMLAELPFPLSLIPNTTFTAFPSQTIKPPFLNLIGDIASLAKIAASLI